MEFWGQDGFRDKVNFRNDPVHTPNLNGFAREALVLSSARVRLSVVALIQPRYAADGDVSQ